MSPKILTDAKIRATLYMSKIVFFTLFLTRFHLGGVLGFWDWPSEGIGVAAQSSPYPRLLCWIANLIDLGSF